MMILDKYKQQYKTLDTDTVADSEVTGTLITELRFRQWFHWEPHYQLHHEFWQLVVVDHSEATDYVNANQ